MLVGVGVERIEQELAVPLVLVVAGLVQLMRERLELVLLIPAVVVAVVLIPILLL